MTDDEPKECKHCLHVSQKGVTVRTHDGLVVIEYTDSDGMVHPVGEQV